MDAYGIGQACISRQMPNGSIAHGVFLIDRYCLGVKDAFGGITSRYDFETRLERGSRRDLVSPGTLRHLVESALAYAGQFGLAPHPDYFKAAPIFGDIDSSAPERTWEFGKDGKPFFISGPNDTPARCRQIMAALGGSEGPDGFDYLMQVSEAEFKNLRNPDDTGSVDATEAAAPPRVMLPPP